MIICTCEFAGVNLFLEDSKKFSFGSLGRRECVQKSTHSLVLVRRGSSVGRAIVS